MDTSYTLRAADGKEYGPVTLVQVVAWVHEGRIVENSELRRSDMQHWAAAREFEELRSFFGQEASAPGSSAPQAITPAPGAQQNAALMAQMKSGASWFYWIAGLSLVNSIAALAFNKPLHFVIGLGITQAIDLLGIGGDGSHRTIACILNLFLVGMIAAFGLFANKGKLWAFGLGFAVYALDGISLVTFVWAGRWLDAGFHAVVLFFIFRGMQACRALRV